MLALRPTRFLALIALSVALALLMSACGSDDSPSAASTAASTSDFPAVEGQSLEEIAQGSAPSDLVMQPTQSVFTEGENRYGFGVFTVERGNVPDAEVAVYAADPNGKVSGPFAATSTSLITAPAFASQTTSQDPDAAQYVYTTTVDFTTEGNYSMLAMIREDDGSYSYANFPQQARVGNPTGVPQPGEPAPVIHTPTADDVGGDLTKIDTRQPASSMHDVDFADAVGEEPIVLLFATPALCTSRVCGPVVDIAEEVKSERPDDAAFIHMEIWNDNDPNKGPREQVLDYRLRTEPWLFVIDANGKVSTVIEGAFSKDELNEAIDEADAASGVEPS